MNWWTQVFVQMTFNERRVQHNGNGDGTTKGRKQVWKEIFQQCL